MRISAARKRRDQREPVHARQHAVDDQRVIAAGGRHEEPVAPFGGMIDDIAAFAQPLDDIGGGLAVVLDDQNFHASRFLAGDDTEPTPRGKGQGRLTTDV